MCITIDAFRIMIEWCIVINHDTIGITIHVVIIITIIITIIIAIFIYPFLIVVYDI